MIKNIFRVNHPGRIVRMLLLYTLLALITSCSTGDRQFETPVGPRPGDQTGPWEILGVISKNTSSLKRSNAATFFEEDVTINVPPETILIVPAVRGWSTGYGTTTPEDLSVSPAPPFTWHREDHHLGMTNFNVFVKRVNAVDNSVSPATQTATVTIQLYLSDDNSDDTWFGQVNYTLICLGKKQS